MGKAADKFIETIKRDLGVELSDEAIAILLKSEQAAKDAGELNADILESFIENFEIAAHVWLEQKTKRNN